MRQDVECATIQAAEDQIDRPLWNFDSFRKLAIGTINQKLAGGEVDISICILRKTFSALFREKPKVFYRSRRSYSSFVSPLFPFFS